MKTQSYGGRNTKPSSRGTTGHSGMFGAIVSLAHMGFAFAMLASTVLYVGAVKAGRRYKEMSAERVAARDMANAKRAVEEEVAAQRAATAAAAQEASASMAANAQRKASAATAESVVKREAPSPSRLNDVADEVPAKVIRRTTVDHPATKGAAYWARRPDPAVAFQHETVKIEGKMILFSVYTEDAQISAIRRTEARTRRPLAPYLRSTAAGEKTAFSLAEAIAFTRREFAAAKRESDRKKATRAAQQPMSKDTPAAADQPAASVETTAPREDPPVDGPPPGYGETPTWMDAPCFDEVDARRSSAPSPAQSQQQTQSKPQAQPAQQGGQAAARPQVRREPPPPPADAQARSGWVEGEVSYRGQKRYVGTVISLGLTLQTPKEGPQFEIFAIDIRTAEGEERQFRGYQLADFATQQHVRVGDTISLKRGVRIDTLRKAGGETKKKHVNHYDVHVTARGATGRRK